MSLIPDAVMPVPNRQVSATGTNSLRGSLAILQWDRVCLADGTHREAGCEAGASQILSEILG